MDNSNTQKKRWLVVGMDGFDIWMNNKTIEVAAIVDLYSEREVASSQGSLSFDNYSDCPIYTDLDLALQEIKPDIVMMIVPNFAKNTMLAEEAILASGTDLVVHKLRLSSMADVEQLSRISEASNARFMVGEHYRYIKPVQTLKTLLTQGAIGRAEYVTWECRLPLYESYPWMNAYKHLTLEDLSYHHLGVLHHLLGHHPKRIYAESYKPSWAETTAKTMAVLQVEAWEGYRLHYLTAWNARGSTIDYLGAIRIEGDKGSLELANGKVVLISSTGKSEIISDPPTSIGHDTAWEVFTHVQDTLFNGGNAGYGSIMTFKQFEPVLRTMYGAVESAETQRILEMGKPAGLEQ